MGYNNLSTMKPPPTEAERRKGVVPLLLPLPRWEILKPGDVFRVFEDGGLLISPLFPDLGNPQIDDLGGKPDLRQSIRGLGTGLRISVPVLNLHKTRLNDPHLSFLGTNDHPGDYRSSGCTGCHTIYANDRDPWNSGPYAEFGNGGLSATKESHDPQKRAGAPHSPRADASHSYKSVYGVPYAPAERLRQSVSGISDVGLRDGWGSDVAQGSQKS